MGRLLGAAGSNTPAMCPESGRFRYWPSGMVAKCPIGNAVEMLLQQRKNSGISTFVFFISEHYNPDWFVLPVWVSAFP
jgi:hypothetical protein